MKAEKRSFTYRAKMVVFHPPMTKKNILSLSWMKHLPVESADTNVLGYLSLKDIIMLKRAYDSKKSYQAYLELPGNTKPYQESSFAKNCTYCTLVYPSNILNILIYINLKVPLEIKYVSYCIICILVYYITLSKIEGKFQKYSVLILRFL